jgi:hypothetical protein
VNEVIELLRAMDETQQQTDEEGGAEVAWYYFRENFEALLGLASGALDTSLNPRTEQ